MKSVLIAAGHSDVDSGAVSADGRLKEASLAVQLRDKVAAALIARHVPVKTDGAPGINSPLKNSIAIAKTCDISVEIHFNAGPPTAKGIECLARKPDTVLAQQLSFAIAKQTGSPLRGILGYKSENSGQHHRLGFISDGGGLILEVEFISNPAYMTKYLAVVDAVAASLADVLAAAAK